MNRREFLQASALTTLALGSSLAPLDGIAASGNNLKWIFVFNGGGWDPTTVLNPCFEATGVDMQEDSGTSTYGDLSFVDHMDRPSVRLFFERFHQKTLIMNGVLVPSIAHGNCRKLMMTGTSNDGASDWLSIMAGQQAMERALPGLVLSGPSYPGQYGTSVTRAGTSGQLDALLSGSVINWSDMVTERPPTRIEDLMDTYMLRRASAAVDAAKLPRAQHLYNGYRSSLERAVSLKDLQGVVQWNSGGGLTGQGNLAADLLQLGLTRCVMMNHGGSGWDSHTNNYQTQSQSWESLFAGLLDIVDRLATLPGEEAATLADETVVVVMSEMGRTPRLNGNNGKDHWPVSSVMMVGPGFLGGRTIGATDDSYYGKPIDPTSGELANSGIEFHVGTVGATLMRIADVDPEEFLPGVPPVEGILL